MTPYYQDDAVTIYHGDSREIALTLDPVVVVADPPYGQTSLTWDRWVGDWPSTMPGAQMWCFGTLRMFMDHAGEFAAGDWHLAQDVVWEKHNGSGFQADRFRRVHEQVAHFYRGRWSDVPRQVLYTNDATKRTVRRKGRAPHMGELREFREYVSQDGGPRMQRSVLKVRTTHGYAENETQKPLGIITPLLEFSASPGDLVFDPFTGAGSVLVAAKMLGMRAVGVDVREDQCEIAARRCSQEVLGLAV